MCWCAFLCCVWQPASLSVDMQTFSSCWTRHKKKSGSCETCNCLVARQPWRAALEDLGMSPIISQASITVWKLAGTRDLFFIFLTRGSVRQLMGWVRIFWEWMNFGWDSYIGHIGILSVAEVKWCVSLSCRETFHHAFWRMFIVVLRSGYLEILNVSLWNAR